MSVYIFSSCMCVHAYVCVYVVRVCMRTYVCMLSVCASMMCATYAAFMWCCGCGEPVFTATYPWFASLFLTHASQFASRV